MPYCFWRVFCGFRVAEGRVGGLVCAVMVGNGIFMGASWEGFKG